MPTIKKVDFPSNQYYQKETKKKQIVLHHTVSDPFSAEGDINHWKSTPEHIATHYVITYDGVVNQCYDTKYWGHHLGVTSAWMAAHGYADYRYRNVILNQESIAIEIDSWGGLTFKNGQFYNAYGGVVKNVEVEELAKPWRGFKYFQKYSQAQIDSVKAIILEQAALHKIPLVGITDGNLELRKDALDSVPGIYSHTSYRPDKSDIYPQREIIEMLKSLK